MAWRQALDTAISPADPLRADMKKALRRGPCFVWRRVGRQKAVSDQAATAMALILADRRLLWRAALFLWKMPLSAIESITD